jgi:hypothetical protein
MTGVNIGENGRRAAIAEIEWFPRPDGLERATLFQPGYNGDPSAPSAKNYGVHGMEITWLLRGPKGGVQFKLFTDWIPGERSPGHGLSPDGTYTAWDMFPMGADLGYHARVPQYDGQEDYARDGCEVTGGRCYYDGSGLRAESLAKEFVVHGEPVIWRALEDEYEALSAIPAAPEVTS